MRSYPSLESKKDVTWLTNVTTPEGAYVLGLLWADGSLHMSRRSCRVSLHLVAEDFDEVHHLFSDWGFCVVNWKLNNPYRVAYVAALCHKKFCHYLNEHDYFVKSMTTPTKILSTIPVHLKPYFFLGWSDGDGHWNCVSYGDMAPSIAGAVNQDWTELKLLCSLLGIESAIRSQHRDSGDCSSFYFIGMRSTLRFGYYIYSTKSIGIPRKRDRWEDCRRLVENEFARRREKPIGVFPRKDKFEASFTHDKQTYYLGLFPDRKSAAVARDNMAWEMLKDETRLNFPEQKVPSFFTNYGVTI